MATLVLTIAVMSLIAHVVFSMLIIHQVSKRGVKINIPLLRLYIIKYAHQYKQFTKQETGKIGALFYLWIFSINFALLCALAALVFHWF
jgi:hypothetical protein